MNKTSKTFPFRLIVTRPGSRPVPIPFASHEDMETHITSLYKKHFVGQLQPEMWNGSTWVKDVAALENLTETASDHKQAFTAASKLFNQLAKEKALSSDQQTELVEVVMAALQAIGISFDAEPDEVPTNGYTPQEYTAPALTD